MKPFCEGCHNINRCFYHMESNIKHIDICQCKECILFSCCSCSCEEWINTGSTILWNEFKKQRASIP